MCARTVLNRATVVFVEIDEDSHRGYDCSKERVREKIFVDHTPKGSTPVMIRFNPDAYEDYDGVVIPSCFKYNTKSGTTIVDPKQAKAWQERLDTLFDTIRFLADPARPSERLVGHRGSCPHACGNPPVAVVVFDRGQPPRGWRRRWAAETSLEEVSCLFFFVQDPRSNQTSENDRTAKARNPDDTGQSEDPAAAGHRRSLLTVSQEGSSNVYLVAGKNPE